MRYIKLESGWISASTLVTTSTDIFTITEGKTCPRPEPNFYTDFGKDPNLPGFWESLGNDTSKWALEQLGLFLKSTGRLLLEITPDACITLAMALCLGTIASIPKTGKWTAISLLVAIMSEAIRQTLPPY